MDDKRSQSASSIWALPLLCLGLGIIAVCVLVPAAESNKRLVADRDKLQRDLGHVQAQLSTNQTFLDEAATDPEIAERLAQRQFRQIRAGTALLQLKGVGPESVGRPFEMLALPPPPPVAEYRPLSGFLGDICSNATKQMDAVGMGMFMVAAALVLGASSLKTE